MFRAVSMWTARRAVPLAVLGVVITAGVAAAAPANHACPAGFETITVAQAQAQGYIGPPLQVDTAGNGDGVVCRRALGGPPGSFQVYFWVDNSTARNL
jgi:hypothetical protein